VDVCLRERCGHFKHLLSSRSVRSSQQKAKIQLICLVILMSSKLVNTIVVGVEFQMEHSVVIFKLHYTKKLIHALQQDELNSCPH
jgi:hypothetical protein